MQANPAEETQPNRLINEKSPYLLQHAYNPVDWYPWGKEALEKAKAENKLIFLSIGYSTCHWCHVMAKEVFEDAQAAAALNSTFVCIKVDREERPDLDAQYMVVCQTMGRSCGWPLNVLLTPSLNPFYVASYIPKYSGRGLIGILDLVSQVGTIWRLRKDELDAVGTDIKNRLQAYEKRTLETTIDADTLEDAYNRLAQEFDPQNGGFGGAPRFPRPHNLLFLLRYWKRTGTPHALEMAQKTFRQMRVGGIFDQIGFGFHRYSTDAQWLVPHFEKMLYDQALLILAYTEAYQTTGAPKFRLTATETLEYALRDLRNPQGGFCSAEDADSEGVEGKFYLWTLQEIMDTLQPADANLAVHLFDLSTEGNFSTHTGEPTGQNILHLSTPLDEIADYKGLTVDELVMRMGSIRNLLFEIRNRRVHPAKDEKVLTDWNGLMVAALAKAGAAFDEQRYVDVARETADFLLTSLQNGVVLYHRFVDGEWAVEGFLDDYAFFVYGLIELYKATFEQKYLQAASQLAAIMISKFWDNQNGGFFFTDAPPAGGLPRMKQVYDGAVPSGNSVALLDLLWLSKLLNDDTIHEKAKRLLHVFASDVEALPDSYTFLLLGLDFFVGPSNTVLIVGDMHDAATGEMLAALRRSYLPNTVVTVKSTSEASEGYKELDNKPTAYVCRNHMCLPPTNNPTTMLSQLGLKETVKSTHA